MMEFLHTSGIILIRILTIFPLMLLMTLFMGRRSIGEMPVFDVLIVLALGSVVGADIAEPQIEHLPTAFAIVAIALLQKVFSILALKISWFGKLVTFEPVVVVNKGKIIHKNLNKTQYTIDNLLGMLREKDIFNIQDVYLAVIEGNGNLSVLKKDDVSIASSVSYPIIREGSVDRNLLRALELSEAWLLNQLTQKKVQLEDVFLGTIDDAKSIDFTLYSEHTPLPPVHH